MICKKFIIVFLLAVLVLNTARLSFAQHIIPTLENIFPAYGQIDVDTKAIISISFNTEMDKKSVEKSFYIFPEIKGNIKWEGKTMKFIPEKPLLPSTSYFVSFAPNIKAVDGILLPMTYFSTPAEGVFVSPEGKLQIVSINASIKELPVEGFNPVWYRDNKSIIYDHDGKIWQVDTNGENRIQLTLDEETYIASNPVGNPLTDKIAFIGTNAAGSANIYTIDKQTQAIMQLTSFYEPNEIKNLRWSPDGLYLAFLRAGQIWIMNQDGSDMKKLTNDVLGCKGNFAWSPGGTKIAFGGDNNVWIGDIYSFELRKMSFDDPNTGLLDWSADNKIVFELDGLSIMDADGSEEIKIKTAAKNPVWINDGGAVSFVLPLYNNDNKAQLWIMDAKGEDKKKIAIIDSRYPHVSWSRNMGFWNLFSP